MINFSMSQAVADKGKAPAVTVLKEYANGCVFVQDGGDRMLHALPVVNCDFMTEEANGVFFFFIAFPSIGRTQVMNLT